MSIIAVKGVPATWSLKRLTVFFAKTFKAHYEAKAFEGGGRPGQFKVAYLRLPPNVDPLVVIEDINRADIKKANLSAFLPEHVPHMPISSKKNKIPLKIQKKHKIVVAVPEQKLLPATHREILKELQIKYTGLLSLSRKTHHKLLTEISRIVFDRLKYVIETNTDTVLSGYTFSRLYRRAHPHFADFQFILSTLHRIEDAEGVPRTQISEQELCAISQDLAGKSANPTSSIHAVCDQYASKISAKISAHINELDPSLDPGLPPQQAEARAKVRGALKKLAPFIGSMVSQVISGALDPTTKSSKHVKMRIYGEPFLPNKEMLGPVLKPFCPVKVIRSQQIYNMIRLDVPIKFLSSVMELDGYEVAGAKLVIRLSDQKSLNKEDSTVPQIYQPEVFESANEMDEDDMEDWTEEI